MDELPALLDRIESDPALHRPDQLRQRAQLADQLEFHLLALEQGAFGGPLRQRAERARLALEAADAALYRAAREELRAGRGAQWLRQWQDETVAPGAEAGYDHLDQLVAGVLALEDPGEPLLPLGAGMVFYQPTPARQVFDLLGRLRLDEHDVLVDLGAGLGHVALLAAACSPAASVGIEREARYVACAQRCAARLGLARASFLCQDARDADLSRGTVFYLYTPFAGAILREVLQRLAREASARPLRICTLGPCTAEVAAQPWLRRDGAADARRVNIFSSG